MAVWTGAEQKTLPGGDRRVQRGNPDVEVKYTSAGDQLPTVLSTAVEGGNPPDIAARRAAGPHQAISRPGQAQADRLRARRRRRELRPSVVELGTVDGTALRLVFKAANKSTVWYNVHAFKDAGVEPPKTGTPCSTTAQTLSASGVPAYSIGGADGWTLTDLFENIYLRTAGPDKYDQLPRTRSRGPTRR